MEGVDQQNKQRTDSKKERSHDHRRRGSSEGAKENSQKSLREDKTKWKNEKTKKELGEKEQWKGLKHIGQPFKPKRYARKDRNGRLVNLDMRAEATKEYLEKDQWGEKESKDNEGTTKENNTSTSTSNQNGGGAQ